MLKEDFPVWEAFLSANPALFDRVYYDVRIGGVMSEDKAVPEKDRLMFYQNTAKRIDALAENKDELWIIEVATRPGLRAVGQLQTYLALWMEDPKIIKTTKAVLVCQGVDKDIERTMTFYGMYLRYAL
jgi:hypothetical protein